MNEAEQLFTNGEAVVLEGLYSVNMAEKKVYPIYWDGDPLWIIRGNCKIFF